MTAFPRLRAFAIALVIVVVLTTCESASHPSGAVAVDAKDAQKRLRNHVDPVFPPAAKNSNIEGTVELSVIVGTDGRVRDISVRTGPSVFQEAAVDAVRQWTYEPLVMDGQEESFVTEVDIPFKIY